MIIQFCGLSGSGKTTLANKAKPLLDKDGIKTEIIDGDIYRKILCADLGYSKEDRNENIRRLAFVADTLVKNIIVPIICAINPYEDVRLEITAKYDEVKTIYIDCNIDVLIRRDTKQLYRKALLPADHPEKINNLTGVNDPFGNSQKPDLVIKNHEETIETSSQRLLQFILGAIKS